MNLWWRDDDAGNDHPALDQLLSIAARRGTPVVLAVIPRHLTAVTRARIQAAPFADVVQHGLTHQDFGSGDGRKCELVDQGGHTDAMIASGRVALAEAFGRQFLPVMVPPWNRIEPNIRARLPELGFGAISTFVPNRCASVVPGLQVVDTHVDVIAWREGRRNLSAEEIIDQVVAARSAMAGPIGLLTHHAATDAAGFAALDRAIAILQGRYRARFLAAPTLFATLAATAAKASAP